MPMPRFRPLVACALVLAACDATPASIPLAFAPAGPEAAPPPSQRGPFAVGVRTIELTYEIDREQPLRTITVEVWYPAAEEARGRPGRSYDVREYFDDEQRAKFGERAIPLLATDAVPDAAPRTEEGPYPLVVFSHGKGGMRWQSTYFTIALASHGYVVVSPDHENDTLTQVLRGDLGFDENIAIRAMIERPGDVTALLDRYTELPATDPLFGLVDAERIGIAGHSFGGFTSLRMGALDERIDALVPMAPPDAKLAWADRGLEYTSDKPTMVQAARLDRTLPWDAHISNDDPEEATTWELLTGPRWLVEVKTGGHFTFSDLCQFDLAALAEDIEVEGLSRADIEGALTDGCIAPAPPSAELMPALNHYAIGFFNGWLRESPASFALLDQAHAESLIAGALAITAEP